MIKLSAVIITYNEEKKIERCIQSLVEIADEIIIVDSCSTDARTNKLASGKPGPTTDTSSRIARIKKLQTRTRTNKIDTDQSIGGTDRGAHPSVQNPTNGADPRSRRAQLFGNYGPSNPANTQGQTSGRSGDSSQVIYFKNVFDRVTLNQPATISGVSGIN